MITALVKFVTISVVIYLGIALGLIVSQRPGALNSDAKTLDFSDIVGAHKSADPVADLVEETTTYAAMDGARLPMHIVRGPQAESQPVVLMVHGSGWHGAQFHHLGRMLADLAEIRIVTLRGHGASPERRGDIDYMGQLEDDLAAAVDDVAEDREVILLGHSSGSGMIVRMAGGAHGARIDKAILLAPFLQYDAPTTRPNSGGWAHPLTRRIIGLSMLNSIGVHWLDHLMAIQFNWPAEVLNGPLGHTATTAYSWRLNQSYAPRRDWPADVAKLPAFLLVTGNEDESFDASLYQPTMQPHNDKGRYEIIPDVGHLAVVDAPETLKLIREFLQ